MGRVRRQEAVTNLGVAVTVLALAVVASCSGGGAAPAATVAPSTVADASPPPRRNVDGRLRLGVWLPSSGPASTLGTPLLAGMELAVREINEAGGVNGEVLEVVIRDESSDPVTAFQSLRQLLDQDQVDIVLGPASSRVALGALDVLADARVVTCSPTSAALDLGARRDDGFFVRTIGSEALEAVALTRAMIDTGLRAFAVLFPDDDYGLAYANEVQRAFRRLRQEVRLVAYDPTAEQYNGPVNQALAGEVEAVAVVGTGAIGARVLAALAANDAPPDEIRTFVTAGLRVADLGDLIDPRRPTASAGIQGVAPLAQPTESSFEEAFAMASPGTRVAYAAYAYDCVNLLALAAQAAGSDDAEDIQAQITAISGGGSSCQRFAPCAELLASGRNIDFDGASGDLDLQDDGDVGVASYDVFAYDDEGRDVSERTITVRVDVA